MDSYDREWGTGAPLPQGAKQITVSTEPRAQSGPEFACSAWVGQLEAALRTVKELREARPTRDGTEWAMRAGAQECLEWLVRNERGRCPTKDSATNSP